MKAFTCGITGILKVSTRSKSRHQHPYIMTARKILGKEAHRFANRAIRINAPRVEGGKNKSVQSFLYRGGFSTVIRILNSYTSDIFEK